MVRVIQNYIYISIFTKIFHNEIYKRVTQSYYRDYKNLYYDYFRP